MESFILYINTYLKHIPLLHTYFHVTLLWSGNMLIVLFILGLQAHFLKFFLPSYFISIYTLITHFKDINTVQWTSTMCGCRYCSSVRDLNICHVCVLDTSCSVACFWWQLHFFCTINRFCVEWIALFTELTSTIHTLRLLVVQNCEIHGYIYNVLSYCKSGDLKPTAVSSIFLMFLTRAWW